MPERRNHRAGSGAPRDQAARDSLAAGEEFTLWQGGDIGRGVVTRRVFV